MSNIHTLVDAKHYCPKCGNNTVRERSRQVAEDLCEMWFECAKCGHDPAPDDHVETVWGWDAKYAGCAAEAWADAVLATPAAKERE